ncbi:MAG: DUF6946 family protein [Solirubrobacteraceae bacterium]
MSPGAVELGVGGGQSELVDRGEGKAAKPYGSLVSECWRDDQGGKDEAPRLRSWLGLPSRTNPATCATKYCTASAVIEAGRFNGQRSMMVIYSFGDNLGGFSDFVRFASMLGVGIPRGEFIRAATATAVPIWLDWVDGKQRHLKS